MPEQDLYDQFFGDASAEDAYRRAPRLMTDAAIRDGKLIVQVTEMLVSAKLSRGDYNRNQVYGHLEVKPVVPWVLEIPVGEATGLAALKAALTGIQEIVAEVTSDQVGAIDAADRDARSSSAKSVSTIPPRKGTSVATSIGTIEGGDIRRQPVPAAVGEEPPLDGDEFSPREQDF